MILLSFCSLQSLSALKVLAVSTRSDPEVVNTIVTSAHAKMLASEYTEWPISTQHNTGLAIDW